MYGGKSYVKDIVSQFREPLSNFFFNAVEMKIFFSKILI